MKIQDIGHLFRFTYSKSSTEIVDKMKAKVIALRQKINERMERVAKVRAEYKITDAVLVDLLQQARAAARRDADMGNKMSYSTKRDPGHAEIGAGNEGEDGEDLVIGAGVVNGLLTENDFIERETSQVAKLALIIRNLKDEERDWSDGRKVGWSLNEDELTYLGF